VSIDGVPVQLIPAYNALVMEALEEAVEKHYGRIKTRVLRPEYLMAIMLQTNRPKDTTRILQLREAVIIRKDRFKDILDRHGLKTKWADFARKHGLKN